MLNTKKKKTLNNKIRYLKSIKMLTMSISTNNALKLLQINYYLTEIKYLLLL